MNEAVNHYRSKLSFETDAWDLNEMVRAESKVVIVDARSAATYAQEHIPHAINFPHRQMNADSTKHLDRDMLYVTYCDGVGCNVSTKGALKLAELGFQVKELIGGIDWWKRDGYAAERELHQPATL
jgi:rhodanese-related sulfurtransferase